MNRTWLLAARRRGAAVRVAAAQTRQRAAKPDLAKAQQIADARSARRATAPTATAPTPANPNLAGQHADYITLQLAHFKAGIRVNAVMQAHGRARCRDADMKALGVYLLAAEAEGPGGEGCRARQDGAEALSRRRRGQRRARVRGVPFAHRRRHSEELSRASPASTPTTRTRS